MGNKESSICFNDEGKFQIIRCQYLPVPWGLPACLLTIPPRPNLLTLVFKQWASTTSACFEWWERVPLEKWESWKERIRIFNLRSNTCKSPGMLFNWCTILIFYLLVAKMKASLQEPQCTACTDIRYSCSIRECTEYSARKEDAGAFELPIHL